MLNETIYKNHASGFEMHKNCHNLINHYGLNLIRPKISFLQDLNRKKWRVKIRLSQNTFNEV